MLNWLIIIGMGLITFAIRLTPILLLERFTLPPTLQRALKYVPIAVLSAIIAPELLITNNQINLALTNDRLLAGLLAIFITWYTKNIILAVTLGMLTLWLLQTI
ncbi:MAG TPA: AzlD domain-containing protein [Anaerolineae bacterium]|nr:AzlD domain-containing protein [Anaerolineae bacterium]